jgi:hypothetical protein
VSPRLYRRKPSHPIPLWNGILEHRDRIGEALWEFIWCLDRITGERDGIGIVLGGAPVKLEKIVAELKGDKESTRRHLKKLETGKYIRMRRTPYGQVIEVLNSKKFGIWGKEKPQSPVSLKEKPTGESEKPQSAVRKEDHAGTMQKAASQPKHETSVWSFLGIEPCGPLSFRSLLETGWAGRNGGHYSILIGKTIDAWEATEGEKPRRCAALFNALAELRQREAKATADVDPLADIRTKPGDIPEWNHK